MATEAATLGEEERADLLRAIEAELRQAIEEARAVLRELGVEERLRAMVEQALGST